MYEHLYLIQLQSFRSKSNSEKPRKVSSARLFEGNVSVDAALQIISILWSGL